MGRAKPRTASPAGPDGAQTEAVPGQAGLPEQACWPTPLPATPGIAVSSLVGKVVVRSRPEGTTGPSMVARDRRPGRRLLRHPGDGTGQRVARTSRAAATRWASAGSTSAYRRVLSPQSGLTHTSAGSIALTASVSSSVTSSDDGTRGEWMS